ncbi:F-box protein [Zostera marina]|uniref:F-box protein n=1 Tax=Zostera marina TaxID=29655 RepID=A0A0K9PMH1_ZOSMR|nr:F-box protein [Zostera marina]
MTKEAMKSGEKKRGRNSKNRYLRPGALAQLCYRKSSSKSHRNTGEKKISPIRKKARSNFLSAEENSGDSVLGSLKSPLKTILENSDDVLESNPPETPKTPSTKQFDSQSFLEALPMDVLVRILCHLHHDQLLPVFHVSQRIRTAVSIARQHHFNYTTPDRTRQEMLRTRTPHSTEHWPFLRNIDSTSLFPPTPKAPRQGTRPPRSHSVCMKQISAVLFKDSAMPNSPSKVLHYPPTTMFSWKSLALNRVLFYEDELCHAVSQHKLM